MRTCEVESCEIEAKHRGRCGKHYRLLLLQGERLVERAGTPAEERFWGKVNKDGPTPLYGKVPGQCWQWTGGTICRGYGQFYVTRMSRTPSHRYAWEALRSPIPDGLTIDHLCRNKLCVNPDHMEVVTRGENTLRAVDIGAQNRNKTRCIKGHEFSPENTRITPAGRRRCRTCDRDNERARRPSSKQRREEALAIQAAEAADAYQNGHPS
jgi:hypothetical protein